MQGVSTCQTRVLLCVSRKPKPGKCPVVPVKQCPFERMGVKFQFALVGYHPSSALVGGRICHNPAALPGLQGAFDGISRSGIEHQLSEPRNECHGT